MSVLTGLYHLDLLAYWNSDKETFTKDSEIQKGLGEIAGLKNNVLGALFR